MEVSSLVLAQDHFKSLSSVSASLPVYLFQVPLAHVKTFFSQLSTLLVILVLSWYQLSPVRSLVKYTVIA